MIKILTFTTLFPNEAQPIHGIFVENRLRHLLSRGDVQATVLAPVPWFPFRHPRFGTYARYARVPRVEQRHGIAIYHPRYPLIPKVGMTVAPALLAASALSSLRGLIARGLEFDLIDAHYFYPDGVAAALIGAALGKPVVITGRGTDLNQIPTFTLPRRQIQWAAGRAAGLVTVCAALKDSLVALGISPERVVVLRNGVDLNMFRPVDRAAARARYGITGLAMASVGGLVERKGHHHAIGALTTHPSAKLFIAGDGPERQSLGRLAASLGLAERVVFLGAISHAALRDLYEAVDLTVLASSREGWANVLLESMACGTPVVASDIWGTPEVVAAPEAGVLVDDLSATGFASGISRLLAGMPDRERTRNYASRFTWDETSAGQYALFSSILRR